VYSVAILLTFYVLFVRFYNKLYVAGCCIHWLLQTAVKPGNQQQKQQQKSTFEPTTPANSPSVCLVCHSDDICLIIISRTGLISIPARDKISITG